MVEMLHVSLNEKGKEVSTLETRVSALDEEKQVLTLDLTKECTKVTSLKDMAKAKILTRIYVLE